MIDMTNHVNHKNHVGNTVQTTGVLSKFCLKRLCVYSLLSIGTFCTDTFLRSISAGLKTVWTAL